MEAVGNGLLYSDFPKELHVVFNCIAGWFSSNDEELTVDSLSNLVFATNPKDKDFYTELVQTLKEQEASEESSRVLLTSLLNRKKLKDLSLLAYEAYEGRATVEKFLSLVEALKAPDEAVDEDDVFVSDDIELIVDEAFKTPGLTWRLNTMNKMLGSLRPGDFGFVFARPETGKTTFLASELTYMAEQASGPVLWLANEEDPKKVMMRLYQAAFGIDMVTLLSGLSTWKQKFDEKFENRLKVVGRLDIMHKDKVQRLCDKLGPSLLVIDQLSKIQGFKNDRKDLELGDACEWGRVMAKTYAPVVAVHQADGTAEGIQWLNMNHVSNAKTAMQAEADWILGIGCTHKSGYESIRYLSLSKNKLTGDQGITDPGLRHGHCEVAIEPHVARYKDLMYK